MNLSELKNLIGSVIVRGTSIRRMQRCSQRRAEFVQRSAEVHHLSGNTFGRPPSREGEYLPYYRTVYNKYHDAINKYEEAGDTVNANRLRDVASDIKKQYVYRDDNSPWLFSEGLPVTVYGTPFKYKNLGGKKSNYVRKSKSKYSRKLKSKYSRKSKSKSKYSRKY